MCIFRRYIFVRTAFVILGRLQYKHCFSMERIIIICGGKMAYLYWYDTLTFAWALFRRLPKHDDVIKWKHFQRYWPLVRGIHRSPVNSPHIGQWRGALMFSLICTWINGWVNNGEAGDLRRHRAHYDITVMRHHFRHSVLYIICSATSTFIMTQSQLDIVYCWGG